jgi:hypothetical protein
LHDLVLRAHALLWLVVVLQWLVVVLQWLVVVLQWLVVVLQWLVVVLQWLVVVLQWLVVVLLWLVVVLTNDISPVRFTMLFTLPVCPMLCTSCSAVVQVAGSRKLTDMIKIAKLGKAKQLAFFELAFVKNFVGAGGKKIVLAPSLFGRLDPLSPCCTHHAVLTMLYSPCCTHHAVLTMLYLLTVGGLDANCAVHFLDNVR